MLIEKVKDDKAKFAGTGHISVGQSWEKFESLIWDYQQRYHFKLV